MQNLTCPSCFAPLPVENRFAKLVTCDFCGQVSAITDSGLDPTGRTSQLAQLPSDLYVDARGTLGDKPFRVLGRLRYQTDSAYWDEWFLVFDDNERGWLVEDEGNFTYYVKKTLTGSVPPFPSVSVGQTVNIDNKNVFITERGEAKIAGGEGQLAFQLLPGERVDFIDGTYNNNLISVEYGDKEIEFSMGRPIERSSLVIQDEEYL